MAGKDFKLHMYSHDTDVLLLALCWVPKLDTNSEVTIVIRTGEHSRKVMLIPIYDTLGQVKHLR